MSSTEKKNLYEVMVMVRYSVTQYIITVYISILYQYIIRCIKVENFRSFSIRGVMKSNRNFRFFIYILHFIFSPFKVAHLISHTNVWQILALSTMRLQYYVYGEYSYPSRFIHFWETKKVLFIAVEMISYIISKNKL